MDQKIKYGYWGVRGAGQVGRLLLAYTGATWENVKYTTREDWFDKDKKGLGLQFPNLPYLIDGDFKLTESRAINSYIIKKSGKTELLGKNLKDEARVECLIGVFTDVRTALMPLVFDPEWKNKLNDAVAKITPKLDELSKFYGDNEFSLGYLTLADFYISEFSYYVENIAPEVYAKYSFLKKTRTAFEALPEIKKYYADETSLKGPFFPPTAQIKF